jgi:hypothetical protein
MLANGSSLITIPQHAGNQLTESLRFVHQIREFLEHRFWRHRSEPYP